MDNTNPFSRSIRFSYQLLAIMTTHAAGEKVFKFNIFASSFETSSLSHYSLFQMRDRGT